MSLEASYKAMYNFGISTNKAAESIKEFVSHIPPFTEDDILRIRKNTSLSMVAKIRIIRNMRKQMKGETKCQQHLTK